MRRIAILLVLFTAPSVASAGDLPPGALARLGDDRFRAGGEIEHLAISPDGTQVATATWISKGVLTLAVWDAATGRPTREYRVNRQLFKGFVWSEGGAFAIVTRAEPATKDQRAKVYPDDFRVWDFTKAAPPLLPQDTVGLGSPTWWVDADWPRSGPEYTEFRFSADGKRVAAARKSADDKHSVHVFELKEANTAENLKQSATLDLGAEGIDDFRVSADGKFLVTFRRLANSDEMTATVWTVATGKPAKPVRVPFTERPMLTPDARTLVAFADDYPQWGFDKYDLATGEKGQLIRWKRDPNSEAGLLNWGGSFSPSGRELVVVVFAEERKTYVIDLTTGKERGHLEGHRFFLSEGAGNFTAVSADGSRIATADTDGLIRLWDAKTLRAISDAPGHRTPVSYARLSPDSKRLLTWAPDKTVRLWDIATGKELRAFAGVPGPSGRADLQHGGRPTFTPDGTAVIYSTDKRLLARDLQTGLEIPLPGKLEQLEPRAAVFAPDGKTVLTWVENNAKSKSCEVWSWPDGKKLTSWDSDADDFAPGFSADGSVIFTHPASPERRDSKTGKELSPAWKEELANQTEPLRALHPDPQWVINNAKDNPVVIEAGSGKQVPGFRLTYTSDGNRRVSGRDLALSPKGGQFAGAAFPNGDAAIVCEIATGDSRRKLDGHRGRITILGFTPDGTKLLTAGGDHTVLVWDMRLAHVPLPEALKKETDALKLWNTLATGNAKDAYLAMARLAREPDAAVKMAKLKLKPVAKAGDETDASRLADARAIELLESLNTEESREFLKELTGGNVDVFRTQEAKRALERLKP